MCSTCCALPVLTPAVHGFDAKPTISNFLLLLLLLLFLLLLVVVMIVLLLRIQCRLYLWSKTH